MHTTQLRTPMCADKRVRSWHNRLSGQLCASEHETPPTSSTPSSHQCPKNAMAVYPFSYGGRMHKRERAQVTSQVLSLGAANYCPFR